jgi:hypothetical protein
MKEYYICPKIKTCPTLRPKKKPVSSFPSTTEAANYSVYSTTPGTAQHTDYVDHSTTPGSKKEICPAGFYCPKNSEKIICPSNSFSVEGSQSISECKCSFGYYKNEYGTCIPCPVGYYCPDPSKKIACPINSYGDKKLLTNKSDCKPCPGYFCYKDTLSDCGKGYYCPEYNRLPCPAGTYNNTLNAQNIDSCISCPSGKFSSEGQQECLTYCQDGTYQLEGSNMCLKPNSNCPEGYYKNTVTNRCVLECPEGYYGDSTSRKCITKEECLVQKKYIEPLVYKRCLENCPYDYPTNCNNICVDLNKDLNNCGSCGKSVPRQITDSTGNKIDTNIFCQNGKPYPIGDYNYCSNIWPTTAEPSKFVISKNDINNCGSCGIKCDPKNHTCRNGYCVCKDGYVKFNNKCVDNSKGQYISCNYEYIDKLNDSGNCGKCGNTCPFKQICCNGSCKDLITDSSNCGKCGIVCDFGTSCCNGKCINLNFDTQNCGSCGNKCPSGTICCNKSCVNAQTDSNNCGNTCTKCETGKICCNGSCVDTKTDLSNCGTCGTKCETGKICCNGSCVDIKTDLSNCGTCGNNCTNGTCENGNCICNTGFVKFDNKCVKNSAGQYIECPTGSGVYKNKLTDPLNCGSCDNKCTTGKNCCNGICVDLQNDPSNCGSCGNTCSNKYQCVKGQKICAPGYSGINCSTVMDANQYLHKIIPHPSNNILINPIGELGPDYAFSTYWNNSYYIIVIVLPGMKMTVGNFKYGKLTCSSKSTNNCILSTNLKNQLKKITDAGGEWYIFETTADSDNKEINVGVYFESFNYNKIPPEYNGGNYGLRFYYNRNNRIIQLRTWDDQIDNKTNISPSFNYDVYMYGGNEFLLNKYMTAGNLIPSTIVIGRFK